MPEVDPIILPPQKKETMMEEQIALFLSRFKELKRRINNSPSNLSWLAKEQKDIARSML